jgi:hypothetical protein
MTIMNPRPADALRAALKAAGFNARRVSVRADNSLLRVTIRDASASLTKVKAIAAPFESVRHCQATGEILAGGNIFLACEYADALVAPVKATILAVLDPAPNDEYVALSGGYHAMKCTRQSGQGASYVWEVQMKGPGFTWSNESRWALAGRPSGSRWPTSTPAHWRSKRRRARRQSRPYDVPR